MTFPFGKYYFLWLILNFRSVSFCLIVLPHSLSSCHGIFSLCLYRMNLFPVSTSAWPKPRKPWIYWVAKGQENKGNSPSSLKSPCIWLHVDMNTGGITLDVQICGSFVVNLIDSFPKKSQSMYYYRWWFQRWFIFIPIWGKWSNLTNIFQLGWFNHQLYRFILGWCPISKVRLLKKNTTSLSNEFQDVLQLLHNTKADSGMNGWNGWNGWNSGSPCVGVATKHGL